MFEEFGPGNPPQPPSGALEQAMNRGRKIRRQRRVGIVSGAVLSAALVGGFFLVNPLATNQAVVVPAKEVPAPDYSPIPQPASDEKGLDYGALTGITTSGGVITLHVDREKYYTGAEAVAKNGGPLDGEYFTEDEDGDKNFSFILDPAASIQAEAYLRNDGDPTNERETLTVAQLVRNVAAVEPTGPVDPDTDIRPRVWLRHTGGPDGPVTALTDQFFS